MTSRGLTGSLVVLAFGVVAWCGASAAQEAVDIGNRLEPFVDHFLIDRMDGVTLKLHEPRPAEKVLLFDKPWEGRHCGYVTVLLDGDVVRMYYRGLPSAGKDGSDAEVTCYAESRDGVHFEKPNLGLYEAYGTKENNCILAGQPPFSHNFAPLLDTRPGVPAEERFKALAGTSETGLVGFVSGDGIHWRRLQDAPLITKGAFDSQNVAFWSEHENCYVAFFRIFTESNWGGFRWVARSTSPDFINWSEAVAMDKGDAPWEHIYTNQTIAYYRAPHVYLAIAARFMPGRRVVSPEEAAQIGVANDYAGDCSDNVLMTSRGGNRYDRTFMEALIKPEIGLEHWISRTNYPVRGLIPSGENEMSLYIQRNYGQLTGHVLRYVLRADGFVSVNAPYAGGELVTKPFTFSGKELCLNFATSAPGGIKVEVQDAAGAPVPGRTLEDAQEIIGNRIERVVSWKDGSDLSPLAGKPIRLRFIMKDADLYALRFN